MSSLNSTNLIDFEKIKYVLIRIIKNEFEKIFSKYKNKYNDSLVLALCKVKYYGNITSKYILASESSLLESSDIIYIISNIFTK